MLNLYQSNRLEALVTLLSNQLKMSEGLNPLSSDVILVQSPGMSQWLKLEIAEQNGIAANLEFPLPSSFIWLLYQNVLQNVPKLSPFNKDRMAWKIYRLLPDHLLLPEFSSIKEYLVPNSQSEQETNGLDDTNSLRLFQLSEKIADVFDNYLMYRPQWLSHWQQGHNDLPDETEQNPQPWQAILWRDLFAHTLAHNTDVLAGSPLHRADMHAQLLEALRQPSTEQLQTWLPERLFVFGISTMPKAQLQVLQAIGQHIEVEILWLNPCSQYWGDILSEKTKARLNQKQREIAEINSQNKQEYFVTGNPLLASLGKVGRDYLEMLHQEDVNIIDLFIQEASQETVLNELQRDILELEFRGSPSPLSPSQLHSDFGKRCWPMSDDSIRIHSCHSAIRELEVLKDQLLAWFATDPALKPKDILVMMPDVDQYAPFIDSVFSYHQEQASSFIPYTIADRSGLEQHPVLNTFLSLLALPGSRFNVSEIVDFLDVPNVMASFNLQVQEVSLLKQWVLECQIKWGQDAAHKAQWQLPEVDLNTWLYGLQRMVLGVALGEDESWQDILAYPQIEGLNTEILGKLLNYFSFLVELSSSLEQERSLEEWQQLVSALINHLFAVETMGHDNSGVEALVIQQLRDSNQALLSYQETGDFTGVVDFKIIHRYFSNALNVSGVTQRFLAGKMNFCTLMPMRSVPFKVICILGLNEQDYPRQVDPISFDLVAQFSPRKGDRSRKLDDRYLFLEALASVRDKLYLSYIGQSQKTNEALVPSVVLEELIDYLEQSYIVDNSAGGKDLRDQIIVPHKLQPFDPVYFTQEGVCAPYFSYDQHWWQVVKSQQDAVGILASDNPVDPHKDRFDHKESTKRSNIQALDPGLDRIDLKDLCLFWRHPIKHFYRQLLDINLDLESERLSDHEVFQHDGLEQYHHSEALLQAELHQAGKSNQRLLRSGAYPVEAWGEALMDKYVQQNTKIKQALSTLTGKNSLKAETLYLNTSIEIDGKPVEITADLESINGVNLIIRNGKIRPVDQLLLWLTHLMLNASGSNESSFVLANDDKAGYLPPVDPDLAQQCLSDWLVPYLNHMNSEDALLWHITPAMSWYESMVSGGSEFEQQNAVLKTIQADGFSRTLANDAYASKHLKSIEDFSHEFYRLSQTLLPSLLDNITVAKTDKIIGLAQSDDKRDEV